MKNPKKSTYPYQTWTTEQLVDFSKSLGDAYYPGFNQNQNCYRRSQGWDTSKLIKIGKDLIHAYHPGL